MKKLMACLVFCWSITASAHQFDSVPRIAVISAYPPEASLLRAAMQAAKTYVGNGVTFTTGVLEMQQVVLFLSGISMVNAAMNTQFALERFNITHIIYSGIAGGVDPALNLGDVVVAARWGQYLEVSLARKTVDGWMTPPMFSYPFANYDMLFPRALTVTRDGQPEAEERFWFAVDPTLLHVATAAVQPITLQRCTTGGLCLDHVPRVVIGGNGVSGSAFVDNAAFREYTFRTFNAKVLDMESAAVAHVAYTNNTPFIVFRSLSDLAGGEQAVNAIDTFFQLAANNSAQVVRAFLKHWPR